MTDRASWYALQPKNKIFGIGLTKTGTMSLAEALSILGFKSKHYPWSLEEIEKYEAVTDIPVSCRFRELDIIYPNSKFILTTREYGSWIKTTSKKPADPFKPPLWKIDCRVRMYGCIHWDREKWTIAYNKHLQEVKTYFTDKFERLLVLPLEQTDKWEILCKFLDKEIPNVDYPRLNRTISKRIF